MTDRNETSQETKQARSNTRIAVVCASVVLGMVGMAYASVPLYRLFCQVTGYGGTTQTATSADGIEMIDRDVTVRFDANVDGKLPWEFKPLVRSVTIKMGEQKQISFFARNNSDKTLTGMATFNVTPQSAGIFFNKIQCFCFTETTLKPGESLEMPVVFFVDPDMASERETRNIDEITLSYTLYEREPSEKPVAALKTETPDAGNSARQGEL